MDIKKMYESGMSIPAISLACGAPRSTVRSRLVSSGVAMRTRGDAVRAAAKSGLLGHSKGKRRPPFSDQWKQNMQASAIARGEATAKGVRTTSSGYVEYTRGEHKGRGVHVVIMEKQIGRRLYANECVHHKNEEKADNRVSNLELMTRADHASHHAKENNNHRQRDEQGRYK